MTIIIFFIILGILILSHEFGHFFAAKRSGVRVDEFGLGFPPRLLSKKKGETTYSLNLIPFGGFVKIHGENPDEESEKGTDHRRAIGAQPRIIQAIILIAGIVANLVLAWLLLIIAFATTGLPIQSEAAPAGYQVDNPHVTIVQVKPESPAEESGLIPGDQIVHLRNSLGRINNPTIEELQKFVSDNLNKEIIVGYVRTHGSDIKPIVSEKSVQPRISEVTGLPAIGVGLETIGRLRLPLPRAIIAGSQSLWRLTSSTVTAFAHFITSIFQQENQIFSQVTGPVGLVALVGEAKTLGFGYLLLFTSLISINLAILNLLPIPALDGGRLLFLLIEAVRGKTIKPIVVNTINLAGFILLMALMFLVTWNDVLKLFDS